MEQSIEIADGTFLEAKGTGSIALKVSVIGKPTNYMLQNVRYIPKARTQLLSEIALVESGHTVIKSGYTLTVKKNNIVILQGEKTKTKESLFSLCLAGTMMTTSYHQRTRSLEE